MKTAMRYAALFLIITCLAVTPGGAARDQAAAGLIVEAVQEFSAGDRAGIRPGDVLMSWQRTQVLSNEIGATGDFVRPFDAREFEIEQLPRGHAAVRLRRGDDILTRTVIAGFWGVTTRPQLADSDIAVYLAGLAAVEKDPAAALRQWRPLIDRWRAQGRPDLAAWLLTRAASAFVPLIQFPRADELFGEAVASAIAAGASAPAAFVWEAKGVAFSWILAYTPTDRAADARRASQAFAETLSLREPVDPDGLATAIAELDWSWTELRRVARARGTEAGELLFQKLAQRMRHALARIELLAPRSFEHGRAFMWIGALVEEELTPPQAASGDDRTNARYAAETWRRQALAIFDETTPIHRHALEMLQALSSTRAQKLHFDVGARLDPDTEQLYRRCAALMERLRTAPEMYFGCTHSLALILRREGRDDEALQLVEALSKWFTNELVDHHLLQLYERRGDLAAFEGLLTARLAAAGPEISDSLLHFAAQHAIRRGEYGAAEVWLRKRTEQLEARARVRHEREIEYWRGQPADLTPEQERQKQQRLEPNFFRPPPTTMSGIYTTLASLSLAKHDTSSGIAYLAEAVRLNALLLNPDKQPFLRLAGIQQRSQLARLRGDLRTAEEVGQQAVTVARDLFANSTWEADALLALGETRHARGDFALAEATLLQAAAIRERLQPGTQALAAVFNQLGLVARDSGQPSDALRWFGRAVRALESQRARRDRSTTFDIAVGIGSAEIYVNYIELLVATKRLGDAFELLERSRARGMAEIMADRPIRFQTAVPQPLDDERRRLESEYDALQARITAADPAVQKSGIASLTANLFRIRMRLEAIEEEIRAVAPAAAATIRPAALSLAQARAELDAGTVLLSYVVGPAKTTLFVVTPAASGQDGAGPSSTGLSTFTIQIGENDLRTRVAAFRNVLDLQAGPGDPSSLHARARALYDALVRPAEALIAGSQRILICPDGPLHALPFAALMRTTTTAPQYLVEWKPMHTTMSMSVYAEVRKSRSASGTKLGPVVAFGDPAYLTPAKGTNPEMEYLVRRNADFASLPASRREVQAIAGMYAPRSATYVGQAATESQAKVVGKSARLIHFAVHGVLNEYMPLNSALAFSSPTAADGNDNGLLQAWEIFEHMRLDADLVTLSACDTALGGEIAGEGLIGLTRAFLYAGARSVAASLWKVSDAPTAELMTRFYQNLREGQSKDQALRAAQLSLIRSPRGRSGFDLSKPIYWAAFQLSGDWQ